MWVAVMKCQLAKDQWWPSTVRDKMHPVMRAIEHHVNPVDAYLDVFVDSYVVCHNLVTLTPTLANIM